MTTALLDRPTTLFERAERIRAQQPKDKNKLYALHVPEGKGKAKKSYEFGVKASSSSPTRAG